MNISILIVLSLLSLIHLSLSNPENTTKLKLKSLKWFFILLLFFIYFVIIIDQNQNIQFLCNLKWLENNLNLNWGHITLGIDGLSLSLIGLSIILMPLCLLITWNSINYLVKEYLICLHLILFFLVFFFSVLEIMSFYLLFEVILIPMFMIIGIWGSREEKISASFYFFFYTLTGSFLMLLSIFKLYSLIGNTNYLFLSHLEIPSQNQKWLFLGFIVALGVKIPMIPTHLWLPQAHVEAPVSGSVLLAGILLKLGGYGFLRLVKPILTIGSLYYTPLLVGLSLLALYYAAFSTFRQNDIKRLIAYSSISHMGLVTLGIFLIPHEGLVSATIMMIAHGIISSGLFMSVAIIYDRYHSRALKYYKGLSRVMPLYAAIVFILILANMAFPPSLNFTSELTLGIATINYSFWLLFFVIAGSLITTCYCLFFFNRIFFGVTSSYLKNIRDTNKEELLSFTPLILFTIILALYPQLIINLINTPLNITSSL